MTETQETQETDPFASLQSGPVDYGTWEFKVASFVLLDLCEHASVAVSAHEAQRPDLGCFQVRLGGPDIYLQVAATDTERVVFAKTEAVSYKGQLDQAYIPARRLLAILKEAPQGDVTVSVSKNKATVTAGGSRWELQLPSAAAYPMLPAPGSFAFKPYPREKLLAALRSVRHAACRDSSLANLTQVAISQPVPLAERVITASDGSRLARASLDGFPEEFCIPVPVLDDLVRLLSSVKAEKIAVGQAEKLIAFQAGHVILAAAKRSAPFPDMDSQMLKKAQANSEVLSADRDELAAAIRRVRINADAESSAMALRLGHDAVLVLARDEGNSAQEEVPATWKGEDGRLVVVSHVALSEALSAHPEKTCEFWLGKDVGKRRSMVLLSGGEVTQVLTQMQPALVGY